jgi:dynein assembly factor 5
VDASSIDKVVVPFRALLHDRTPSVREHVYAACGRWLSNLMDRYSLGYKLLPFLLCGLHDEVAEYRDLCQQCLDSVGRQYEFDFEDRVKDEVDFSKVECELAQVV